MKVTPVLSENYNAFRNYLSEHKLNPRHFAYVHTWQNLRGYRGIVITVGRWWRNPSYRNEEFYEVINELTYRGDISVIHGTWASEDNRTLLRGS